MMQTSGLELNCIVGLNWENGSQIFFLIFRIIILNPKTATVTLSFYSPNQPHYHLVQVVLCLRPLTNVCHSMHE